MIQNGLVKLCQQHCYRHFPVLLYSFWQEAAQPESDEVGSHQALGWIKKTASEYCISELVVVTGRNELLDSRPTNPNGWSFFDGKHPHTVEQVLRRGPSRDICNLHHSSYPMAGLTLSSNGSACWNYTFCSSCAVDTVPQLLKTHGPPRAPSSPLAASRRALKKRSANLGRSADAEQMLNRTYPKWMRKMTSPYPTCSQSSRFAVRINVSGALAVKVGIWWNMLESMAPGPPLVMKCAQESHWTTFGILWVCLELFGLIDPIVS